MKKGQIIVWVLIIGIFFVIVLGAILELVLTTHKNSLRELSREQAFYIAEAGIEYYKWHLQHFPSDVQDGEDQCCQNPPCSVCGPYSHLYSDPEGRVRGYFSLEIESTQRCGEISYAEIYSTGWTNKFPDAKRKISVKYSYPTVADYSYVLNDNVWAGSDREIRGPYHSNGGIRMDGTNYSIVSSAKSEWVCSSSFGCDSCPTSAGCHIEGWSCLCPGVFTTANGKTDLFKYPVTPFDFDGITVDLANIKDLTKNQGKGFYFPPGVTYPTENYGYYIQLNGSTMNVYRVDKVDYVYACKDECDSWDDWYWEGSIISKKTYLGSYDLSTDCNLVFVEDNLWIEGEVQGKVTIVSADLENPNKDTDIWLPGNITYSTRDGSDGLLLVGQHNILIAPNSPENMDLEGIFIAQKGHFGRNYYSCWNYPSYCLKSYLEIYGAIVSNGRVGTQWTSGWGGVASGYKKRENIYDPNQSLNPPPFLPKTSEEMQLINWKEIK